MGILQTIWGIATFQLKIGSLYDPETKSLSFAFGTNAELDDWAVEREKEKHGCDTVADITTLGIDFGEGTEVELSDGLVEWLKERYGAHKKLLLRNGDHFGIVPLACEEGGPAPGQ